MKLRLTYYSRQYQAKGKACWGRRTVCGIEKQQIWMTYVTSTNQFVGSLEATNEIKRYRTAEAFAWPVTNGKWIGETAAYFIADK